MSDHEKMLAVVEEKTAIEQLLEVNALLTKENEELREALENATRVLRRLEGWQTESRLHKKNEKLREALDTMMSAISAFQVPAARQADYTGNPYYCPDTLQGKALLHAYDLASIALATQSTSKSEQP